MRLSLESIIITGSFESTDPCSSSGKNLSDGENLGEEYVFIHVEHLYDGQWHVVSEGGIVSHDHSKEYSAQRYVSSSSMSFSSARRAVGATSI